MNAPIPRDRLLPDRSPSDGVLPERLLSARESPQAALELATAGTLRVVWESRFGAMLIEVRDGKVFVNGQSVEPAAGLRAAPRPGARIDEDTGAVAADAGRQPA